ncbi:MAG: phosphotransferase [Pseudomonadota bacterium]
MIPKTIDDVSADWLSEALHTSVQSFTTQQIGQGVGIMGDIFRVPLTYTAPDPSLPESVVVKLPSSFEENRAQGVALGMFEAEVRFYNELAKNVSVGIPRVYLAEIESGTAEFVIVMEDLSKLTMVEQSVGMNPAQAQAAVEVLAHVHAAWWDNVQTSELEWIPTMIGPRIEFVDQMLTQILPVFLDGFADYLPAGGVELYQHFAGNYQKINQTIAGRSPWTLVHQDYRVENVMFDMSQSPPSVVILDWQGIGRGPGAYDLAYILSGSMDPDIRREHETSLVRSYYQQLERLGINDYSFEALWDDYGLAQLMGGLATAMVTGGGMDLSNERGVQLIATMATRHVTAALDHNGPERLAKILG